MGRGITNNGIPWQQITGTQAQSLKENHTGEGCKLEKDGEIYLTGKLMITTHLVSWFILYCRYPYCDA
jgi:hypothetical protein